ncbi:hypothetical protein ACH5RR_008169 [Cinchona calisaya]|uniref:RNase H type-1 domain-containing protein n=1 Tax=Cinchona calisaya TaxID=153742 RepID=A0ABD3ADI7_9GENT
MALIKAKKEGWQRIKIESQNKDLVKRINSLDCMNNSFTTILEDILILSSLFSICSFSFVNKIGNDISTKIAQYALTCDQDIVWKDNFPLWLSDDAQLDLRHLP